ncbi:MAG: cytochrome c-type biogenesis protein [Alphaproteobacteria bacterium]
MTHRLRVPGLPVVLALVLAAALLAFAPTARAVQPDEVLADPVLEQRARVLGRELRCLVCQNQSLDDSNADLARDLRLLVRERLQAGDSDAEVLAFIQARYGDFVLLRPPVRPETWALWFAPVAVALLGAGAVVLYFRRRRPGTGGTDESAPLSEAERRRLTRLLAEDGER